MFDISMVKGVYDAYSQRLQAVRAVLKRPLTLTEKILYAHLRCIEDFKEPVRGATYLDFNPDRVAMQDATAQMALLQFMNAGRTHAAVPTTVHCDHLIRADQGASHDLAVADAENAEVYKFLKSVADKYGLGFWGPGAGIIHQVVFENYAFPGGLMIGTDSHTPNAGGMGMLAVGVGGSDASDVISGMPWELKVPRLIGVRLTGELTGWAQPKDVILKLVGLLTVKGGTDCVIEYFGPGAATLPATGKATICNMGAELGATTSVFAFDESMAAYLRATGRGEIAAMAQAVAGDLTADPEVAANPEKYYDKVIDIDLSALQPHLNGPFTPDRAHEIGAMADAVKQNGWPQKLSAALIGSCTNSSFEDLAAAAEVLEAAQKQGISLKTPLIINPGSGRILKTLAETGILKVFEKAGATIMANACGPCIGQWKRHGEGSRGLNSIVTSFNRNFAKRADGNPETHAFVASPVTVVTLALAGRLDFDAANQTLTTADGRDVKLTPPARHSLPATGLAESLDGFFAGSGKPDAQVVFDPESKRIEKLDPFPAFNAEDFKSMALLIKVKGKCTTDHISAAGPWLRFRGHLTNISENLLSSAVNAFAAVPGTTRNPITGACEGVSAVAAALKKAGQKSVIIAEDNYGEGSSREHAAMEPRFLAVRVILTKSFARIHETNLKKQGVLALLFTDPADYDRVRADDRISVPGVADIAPNQTLDVVLEHADGSTETIKARHTYNAQQIAWLRAGSALNYQAALAK